MTLWQRFRTAFALLVFAALFVGIADMYLSFDAIPWLWSPKFAIPVFTLAWLIAPAVNRILPWKRAKDPA